MSETIEQAKEALERAHHASHQAHGGEGETDHWGRNVAIVIGVLAACLALTDLGEKAAQNSYLTHHISVSDTYAFMQAKNLRRATYATGADVIESLPNQDAESRKKIDALRAEAARMADDPKTGEGAKQLLASARALTQEREHAFHTYHQFERATGALQISIVLASVSIVTSVRKLTYVAAAIGLCAALYAGMVATGVV